VKCWDESLKEPGSVEIAVTGTWEGERSDWSAARITPRSASAISGKRPLSIFADLNQHRAIGHELQEQPERPWRPVFVLEQKELSTT